MSEGLPPPERIHLGADRRTLQLRYDNGKEFALPAEYLRVLAPSADVRGHGGVGGKLVSGKREVTVEAVEPVGNYAVRLRFSDTHRNGIYTWKTLLDLALNQEAHWADYLARLDAAGLGRTPTG